MNQTGCDGGLTAFFWPEEILTFFTNERLPTAQALENVLPNASQAKKRIVLRWAWYSIGLIQQAISVGDRRADPRVRSLPFLETRWLSSRNFCDFSAWQISGTRLVSLTALCT
jgi:hypothetical protein